MVFDRLPYMVFYRLPYMVFDRLLSARRYRASVLDWLAWCQCIGRQQV